MNERLYSPEITKRAIDLYNVNKIPGSNIDPRMSDIEVQLAQDVLLDSQGIPLNNEEFVKYLEDRRNYLKTQEYLSQYDSKYPTPPFTIETNYLNMLNNLAQYLKK